MSASDQGKDRRIISAEKGSDGLPAWWIDLASGQIYARKVIDPVKLTERT